MKQRKTFLVRRNTKEFQNDKVFYFVIKTGRQPLEKMINDKKLFGSKEL